MCRPRAGFADDRKGRILHGHGVDGDARGLHGIVGDDVAHDASVHAGEGDFKPARAHTNNSPSPHPVMRAAASRSWSSNVYNSHT
jgi:hypothetical protein